MSEIDLWAIPVNLFMFNLVQLRQKNPVCVKNESGSQW